MNPTPQKYWFVLYTKPRHEFKAEEQIKSLNIEVYLPTTTVVKQWSDRKKKVTEPLFKSYIFIYADEKERLNS
jgi:transcription antitermination factor NusG